MHNRNRLIVGNICVNKFMDQDYTFIFKAIRDLKENKKPSKTFINYCYDKGYIYEGQRDFLLNIRGGKIKNKGASKYKPLTNAQESFLSKILFKLKEMKRY